jgi:NitT/TauT family transport system ATP-binding protein
LRVDGVTPQYKTRQRLVTATCRVSIDVHSAGRQALLEPAGCGKSTLLNAACAYTATTDGAMTL